MGELRSKAGAGGYSGQKEWVKSMVDYLATPTAILLTMFPVQRDSKESSKKMLRSALSCFAL